MNNISRFHFMISIALMFLTYLIIVIKSGITERHIKPGTYDRMNKRLAIGICSERMIAALRAYLKITNGTKLQWKTDSNHLLLRYLFFMQEVYKWTCVGSVNLNAQNVEKLEKEIRFFEKFCELNSRSKGKKIHPTTKKIIIDTCRSLIQMAKEVSFKFHPYRLSNSQ